MTGHAVAMSCPLCERRWSSADSDLHVEACPSCGVPTTVPAPGRDVFSDGLFEEGSYAGRRIQKRKQWTLEASKRLTWIQQFPHGGRMLEVGAATGEFVAVAEAAGFDVVGLEASEWATAASKDLTQSVQRADAGVWLLQSDAVFDVIALFHTLEHIHRPRTLLEPLVRALAPGGCLFIEVPNGAARDAQDGGKWHGACLADHVLHYRPTDLGNLVASLGLDVVDVSTVTMREYDSRFVWTLRRLRWLTKGRVRPSADILRVVARRP